MPKQPLDARTARKLAFLADNCDERSIQKVARGESVRGHVGERIKAVLAEAGLLPAVVATAEPLPTDATK
ncbi:MAG TPA: hypothetical protein VGK67_26410 [Myxococcales bacterium]|jgi:hypothetical protein